jgi:7-carboxy-7-deazaguanine synthase
VHEHRAVRAVNEIHLNDLFYTVQGEGANMGMRALFVRMPFCNLSCSWCDTSFNSFKPWTDAELLKFARKEETAFAVITGGEPSMHKHTPKVIETLWLAGYSFIAMESNGMFKIPNGVNWVTISPKRDKGNDYKILEENLLRADEWKYVVDDDFDFEILKRHGTRETGMLAHRWLSPEFTNFKANVEKILTYIKGDPTWRISLQTHKWINVP